MIQIRRSEERGHFDHGWLNTYHTFSFADYHDPAFMGFRVLRVINEDRVQPGQGFGTHGHRDMEIITYVLSGSLEHKDSMGNGSIIQAGELQHMSAGTGVMHSEFNPSASEWVHLYQIWIKPNRKGVKPSYDQRRFDQAEMKGRLSVVASPTGENGSLMIQQDARLYLSMLDENEQIRHRVPPDRHAWLQVLRGEIEFGGSILRAGDGAAVSEERELRVNANQPSEIILFELP